MLCFLLAGRKHCADKRNDTATGHTSPYPLGHRPKYKTRIQMRIIAMMRMMRMMMRINDEVDDEDEDEDQDEDDDDPIIAYC